MISYLPSIPIRLPVNWTLTCKINDECPAEFGDSVEGLFEEYDLEAPELEEMILCVSISKINDGNLWDAEEIAHIDAEGAPVLEKEFNGRKLFYYHDPASDADGSNLYDLYCYMNAPDKDLMIISIALKTQYKEDKRDTEAAIDFLANLIDFKKG